jgi:hypothetical protein
MFSYAQVGQLVSNFVFNRYSVIRVTIAMAARWEF